MAYKRSGVQLSSGPPYFANLTSYAKASVVQFASYGSQINACLWSIDIEGRKIHIGISDLGTFLRAHGGLSSLVNRIEETCLNDAAQNMRQKELEGGETASGSQGADPAFLNALGAITADVI